MFDLKTTASFFGLICLNASFLNAEEVKVVTYYPAPYSEYKELNTTQNTNLATNPPVNGVPYKVGIGTKLPAQKLDVAGNVQFSGALMPNGIAGTTGQVLTSQGTNAAPVWQNTATQSVIYLNDPFIVKNLSGNPFSATVSNATVMIASSTQGIANGTPVNITDLKAMNATMQAESRPIRGLVLWVQGRVGTTHSSNASKTYVFLCQGEGWGAAFQSEVTLGALQADRCIANGISGNCSESTIAGYFTAIDTNSNGVFENIDAVTFYRVNKETLTSNSNGFVGFMIFVVGYIV